MPCRNADAAADRWQGEIDWTSNAAKKLMAELLPLWMTI